MPEFIVHIGPHKTGTTYLQLSFRARRAELEARGIVFPEIWEFAPGNPSQLRLKQRLAEDRTDLLEAEFAALRQSGAARVLISAEDLSNLESGGLALLRRLIGDDKVRIVFYFRRWCELAPSSWQESIKQGQCWGLPEYILISTQNIENSRLLNFSRKIEPFAETFGADAIHLVSYSELRDQEEDMFVHFARNFLDWPDAQPLPELARANASRDAGTTEILRAMNAMARTRLGASPDDLRRRFDRVKGDARLAPVRAAIARHKQFQRFNDGWPALQALHESLVERYHARMLRPKRPGQLFRPRGKELPWIRPEYMLEAGVAAILDEFYDLLTKPVAA